MTVSSSVPSSTDWGAYFARITALVDDRDRIQILSDTADILDGIIAGHSAAHMRIRPFVGGWAPNEIFGHLADTEWVFGYRIRAILCEDEPEILNMNDELWVSEQRHRERDPAALVKEFRHVREVNLSLWRRMTPPDLKRVGHHDRRGVESLDTTLTLQAGHDLWHIDQARRCLAAVAAEQRVV